MYLERNATYLLSWFHFTKEADYFLFQIYFISVLLPRLSHIAKSLSSLTELNRRTWFWLEICYPETYLLNWPEKKQLNRKTGKFTGFVFLSPLSGPFLLQLGLIILRAAGAVGALSRVQWGSSKNGSLWAFLVLCILFPLPAAFNILCAQAASCVLSLCLRHILKVNIPNWLEHATIMLNFS